MTAYIICSLLTYRVPGWLPDSLSVSDKSSDLPSTMLVSRLWARQRLCVRHARLSTLSPSSSAHLNSLTESDIVHFQKILAPNSILSTLSSPATDPEELSSYNNDWMGRFHGKSTTVLKPKTTQEVSEILKWCNERRIGVVPQGGNTGLVGGSVPVNNEVILSLSNLNKVRSYDPISGELTLPLSPLVNTADPLQRYSCCRRWLHFAITH